MRTVYPMELSD